jgi:hypothetical protein
MHTSQGTHIADAFTITHIQGMHISLSTHITDALTTAQIQGMHISQGTHITTDLMLVDTAEIMTQIHCDVLINIPQNLTLFGITNF